MERATLLVNHVLASESVATVRLQRHAGRSLRLRLDDWPALLPAPPELRFAITPAGLLEWRPRAANADAPAGDDAPADLEISVAAGNPARLLAQGLLGQRPVVAVAGDAALANDVSWVIYNLRWDIRDDLARIFGELPAHQLASSASALAGGLRTAVQGLLQRAAAARRSASPDSHAAPDPPARPPAR